MHGQEGLSGSSERKNKRIEAQFARDVALMVTGIFLSFGFQGIYQYLRIEFPSSDPLFYLAFGVGGTLFALVFVIIAARNAAKAA